MGDKKPAKKLKPGQKMVFGKVVDTSKPKKKGC